MQFYANYAFIQISYHKLLAIYAKVYGGGGAAFLSESSWFATPVGKSTIPTTSLYDSLDGNLYWHGCMLGTRTVITLFFKQLSDEEAIHGLVNK